MRLRTWPGDLDRAAGAAADLRLADDDRAGALAVRRAVLTIGLDLMECGDDSSGYLGQVMTTAMVSYARTQWRLAGIPPCPRGTCALTTRLAMP